MVSKRQLAAVLVALAIVASFYAASIGFGFWGKSPVALAVMQVFLGQPECDIEKGIGQWQNGEITISELMQKFEAKRTGKAC